MLWEFRPPVGWPKDDDDDEDVCSILSIPIRASVKDSLSQHLSGESIVGGACRICSENDGFVRETTVISSGQILILHLKRFNSNLEKFNKKVNCYPNELEIPVAGRDDTIGNISLPIDCDNVHFTAKYRLRATINHSGSMSSGHYWCYVRCRGSGQWFSCDDKIVKPVKPEILNNGSSYLLFYERKQ